MSGIGFFRSIYEKHNSCSFNRFFYHFTQQFKGIEFSGKKILEIGCGKGFTSLAFACISKQSKITAIDEYEGVGANKRNYAFFERTLKEYEIKNITLRKMDFLKNDFHRREFDLIVANHSLHHMVRTKGFISQSKETEAEWINLFNEIKKILKVKGILILKEMTRISFWKVFPIRLRNIDWRIHPTKREFISLLKKVFNGEIYIKNVVNYRLKRFLPLLQNNPLFTYFVTPDFYLIVRN